MRFFWYISEAKLRFSVTPAEARRLLAQSLEEHGKTPDLTEAKTASLARLLEFEQHIEDDPNTLEAQEIDENTPPVFFRFEGPSARLLGGGQLWFATASGDTAILLAGSEAHCISGKEVDLAEFSPSADPLGSLNALFGANPTEQQKKRHPLALVREAQAWNVVYFWHCVVEKGLSRSPRVAVPLATWLAEQAGEPVQQRSGALFTSLPRTRGIALYAATFEIPEHSFGGAVFDVPPGLKRIVVGSPVFIEQIVSSRRTAAPTQPIASVQDDEPAYDPEQQPWSPRMQEIHFAPISQEAARHIGVKADLLLVTATPIELAAVLRLMRPARDRNAIFRTSIGPNTYFTGQFGAFTAALMMCRPGAVGAGASALATADGLVHWAPRAVIMLGIGFGRDKKKQRIGDVLVAERIAAYEPERRGSERIFRGDKPGSSVTLLDRFRNAFDWRFARPDGSPCKMHIGEILSGEKLVDDPSARDQLFSAFPAAIGGEMEGAGLFAAAARAQTEWILVKAISDWADGLKHDRHQPLAAAAAASLAQHVLSHQDALSGILP